MSEELLLALHANGPVSPAVQLRHLLAFGRANRWTFDSAWRWSFERIKWPHDTSHRQEWKAILGVLHDDPGVMPARQRDVWRRAYEQSPATVADSSVGKLIAA